MPSPKQHAKKEAWAIMVNDHIAKEQSQDFKNMAVFETESEAREASNGIGLTIKRVLITILPE
jgi:hypothetical protein